MRVKLNRVGGCNYVELGEYKFTEFYIAKKQLDSVKVLADKYVLNCETEKLEAKLKIETKRKKRWRRYFFTTFLVSFVFVLLSN